MSEYGFRFKIGDLVASTVEVATDKHASGNWLKRFHILGRLVEENQSGRMLYYRVRELDWVHRLGAGMTFWMEESEVCEMPPTAKEE